MRRSSAEIGGMKPGAVAVLGTDTEVGKTIVTGALAMALRRRGVETAAYKPVATGCLRTRQGLVSSDAVWLKRIMNLPDTLKEINPISYRRPLAPWPAALAERGKFPEKKAARGLARMRRSGRTVLVEGVGGVLVPLTRRLTLADLIARMDLPAVLVGRAGLGTINHTLLSIEALRRRNVEVRGIIMNMASGKDPSETSNPEVIRAMCGVRILAVLPKVNGAKGRKALGILAGRFDRAALQAIFPGI